MTAQASDIDVVRTQFKVDAGRTVDNLASEATSLTRQAASAVHQLRRELDEYLQRRVRCRMPRSSFPVEIGEQRKKPGDEWGSWQHTSSRILPETVDGLVYDREVDDSGQGWLCLIPSHKDGRNHLEQLVLRYRLPVGRGIHIGVLSPADE